MKKVLNVVQWLILHHWKTWQTALCRECVFKDAADLLGELQTSHICGLTASVTFLHAASFLLFVMPPALS